MISSKLNKNIELLNDKERFLNGNYSNYHKKLFMFTFKMKNKKRLSYYERAYHIQEYCNYKIINRLF